METASPCLGNSRHRILGIPLNVLLKKSTFKVPELKLGDWKTCRALGHYSFLLLLYALSVVQLLSPVQIFVTPQTAAYQASLPFTVSQSLLKFMSTESVMPSQPLLPPFSPAFNLSQDQGLFQWVSSLHQSAKYWSFGFSISPSNEYSGLISFRMDWFDILAVQGTLKSLLQYHNLKASVLQRSANSHIHSWLLKNT